MLEIITKNWKHYSGGHQWKSAIDKKVKKNMDIYTGDVATETYLPRVSQKEHPTDFADRLKRAENAFHNYPEKIIDIYRNSIFRSGPPNREGNSKEAKRFITNVDGAETHIGDFIRDRIFLLEQIQGGLFVVVDKPRTPDDMGLLTLRDQQALNIFPYAYIYTWNEMTNFQVDRHGKLLWIMFSESYKDEEGKEIQRYRYFDQMYWAVLDKDGMAKEQGLHNLGVVPVYAHYQRRNPKHKFLTPVTALDNVFRLTLKIFEYQSQLEQMIINHVFMKLVLPKKMWDSVKGEGLGNSNVFTFDEEYPESKPYYLQAQFNEITQIKNLVFEELPNKILYFATLRDKVAMPREESGTAKFIDSSDEVSNFLEKASNMERAENALINLAKLWEKDTGDFKVTYNKVFDIKSTNEQIDEIVSIFKQDMGSPAFNKQLVMRLMRNMLGEVSEEKIKAIENDLEYVIDPSLNVDDIDKLSRLGFVNAVTLAKKYNPEYRTMSDDQIKTIIMENIQNQIGISPQTDEFDSGGEV